MESPLCAPCVSGVLNVNPADMEIRSRTGALITGFYDKSGIADMLEDLAARVRNGDRSENVWTYRGGTTYRMVAVLEMYGVPHCVMHVAARGGR